MHLLVTGSILSGSIKYGPLVSTSAVLLVFVATQLIAFFGRKRELKRSWYLKAYLDKTIDKVNDFFDDRRSEMKKSLRKVGKIEDITAKENYISKRLERVSDTQREFISTILQPLTGAYPKIFRDISYIMESFYDLNSDAFNGEKDSNPYQTYSDKLTIIKTDLMSFLSIPVLSSKESKILRKSLAEIRPYKRQFNYGKAFIVFMFLAGVVILVKHNSKANPSPKKSLQTTEYAYELTVIAINDTLLSPSTAEYPGLDEQRITKHNDSTYKIEGYVDSQNQFGAVVRADFKSEIIIPKNAKNAKTTLLKFKSRK